MMTNSHRVKTKIIIGPRVASSVIVSSALGLLSLTAYAAPVPNTLSATTSPTATRSSADVVPPKAQPFQTAPSTLASALPTTGVTPSGMKPSTPEGTTSSSASGVSMQTPTNPGTSGTIGQAAGTMSSATQGSALVNDGDGVPWVLSSEQRPWTLHYTEPIPLSALYLSLPSEKEARIMLPGHASDAAEHAKTTVSRYITDNIGNAAQARSKQLETFNAWAANIKKQKASLAKDDWVVYQFNKEALATLAEFKAKVKAQTDQTLPRMASDVKAAVEAIIPIMNATSAYEQKMQWYGVLTQLKDGIGLYQARVTESDGQLMEAITNFERENPPVARPQGNPPPEPSMQGPASVATPTASLAPAQDVKREPAQPPSEPQKQGSQAGGIIVGLGMVGFAFWLFMKIRKRVARKGQAVESHDS